MAYPVEEVFTEEYYSGAIYPFADSSISSLSSCSDYYETLFSSTYDLDLPVSPNHLQYSIPYKYSSPGYQSVIRTVQIGGFPLYPLILPPTFLIVKSSEPTRVTLKAQSLHGAIIHKFSIDLREGYNNFTGPCESFNFNSTEGVISVEKKIYSIVGHSEGFKSDYAEYYGKSNILLLFTENDLNDNEIRVVLNWHGDVDLDLRATFRLNENYECDISYYNKICGGARLTAVSASGNSGGEEISLVPVGAYQYLFYIKEFKKGKNRLIDALAEVKVYVKNLDFPVARLIEQNEYPWDVSDEEYKIWIAFCFDGKQSIYSLAPVQAFASINELKNINQVCADIFGEAKIYKTGEKAKIEADRSLVKIPKNIVLG